LTGLLRIALAVGLATGVAAVMTWLVVDARAQGLRNVLEEQIEALEAQASLLYRGVYASGGGVNLKMMPASEAGEPPVPLEEVFSFDRNHAICRVDTNLRGFRMSTFQMGEVAIEPHQFFMSMVARTVDSYEVSTLSDGSRQVTMKGSLDCSTEVVQATVIIGSRIGAEPASYRVDAVDGGIGGGAAGDSFAFTAFFDPEEAPVNYAIFGPEFTFTGEMVEGEISIIDPRVP
jgi:hypothetical protein